MAKRPTTGAIWDIVHPTIDHCISDKLACTYHQHGFAIHRNLIYFYFSSQIRLSLNFPAINQTYFKTGLLVSISTKHKVFGDGGYSVSLYKIQGYVQEQKSVECKTSRHPGIIQRGWCVFLFLAQ